MKFTTLNFKKDDYTESHEIIVGTHIGCLKRIDVSDENPYVQQNLLDIKSLNKDSIIHALNFGNIDKNEILIGHANNIVNVYDLNLKKIIKNYKFSNSPIIGICVANEKIIAGAQNGSIEVKNEINLNEDEENNTEEIVVGDNISRMRQCNENKNLIATGGKERKNNLKVVDIEKRKIIFSSKNLPNDSLQLEVPVWDSDVSFLSTSEIVTCSRYGYIRLYDIRTQRRPIKKYSDEEFNFSCMVTHNNNIYVGTTRGELKCFDTKFLKTFKHTYKGCTGSVSDVNIDESGKYLVSGNLDRYVRVHNTDNCVLLYQNYVKTKAMRVLIKNVQGNNSYCHETQENDTIHKDINDSDNEFDQMFENMETVTDDKKSNITLQKTKRILPVKVSEKEEFIKKKKKKL